MTESKAETLSKPPKELLALNPKQESEFKKKVQEAKKKQSSKVGPEVKFGLKQIESRFRWRSFYLIILSNNVC